MSLFGDDPSEPIAPAVSETPIADWQVDLLRKLLGSQGLETMAERQRAIEAAAGRPVDSLRALTHQEALTVAERLGAAAPGESSPSSSSWDEREENTWIDRL